MLVDDESLNESFEKEYAKLKESVQKPGILLAGATGAGKSSLVNMIFGGNTARTGTGKPVTQKIDCYESPDSAIRIYDSKGYETNESGDQDFFNDVIGMVKNPAQHSINIIWYCISCLGARVTDYDANAIREFHNAGCPVAVILTKADNVSEEEVAALRNAIMETGPLPVFETSIILKEVNQIEGLIKWSLEKLPDHLRFAFVAQQKCSFEEKKKKVTEAIAQHVTGAAITGFVPVPFADAPILAANEITLMTRILYLYDLGNIGNAIKGIGIESLLSILGKSTVTSILKFIPGAGQIIGGLINAGVATSITWAFGGAVALACEQVWKAKLEGKEKEVEDMMNNFGTIIQNMAEENLRNKKTSRETIFK